MPPVTLTFDLLT